MQIGNACIGVYLSISVASECCCELYTKHVNVRVQEDVVICSGTLLAFTDRSIIEALKQIALMYIYGTCAVGLQCPS